MKKMTRPPYGHGREALMQATIALVAKKGVSGLTYRALANSAGMTHGAILHHFESLFDLLTASVEYCVENLCNARIGEYSLEDFLEPTSDAMDHQFELQQFQIAVFLEVQREPRLVPVVDRLYETYRRYTLECLEAAGVGADKGMAELLMAVADGVVYQRVVLGNKMSAKSALQVDALRRLMRSYLATSQIENS